MSDNIKWPFPMLNPHKAITQYSLDIWQTEQGLPQNSVVSIAQTTEGYLWLATKEGLVRFDGARFTVYNRKNTPAIVSNEITRLYADRIGDLWAGGPFGLVHYRDRQFHDVSCIKRLDNRHINTMLLDRRHRFWVGLDFGGVLMIYQDEFKVLRSQDGLPSDVITELYEDPIGGAIWIGCSGGICRLDDDGMRYYGSENGLVGINPSGFLRDALGNLWVSTDDGGLHRMEGDRFIHYGEAEGLSDYRVRSMVEGLDGSLWIGTNGGGVNRFYRGAFSAFTTKEGLSNDQVFSLHACREGSLWIGTSGGGLNRLRENQFTTFGIEEGLAKSSVYAIYEDPRKAMWFGSNDGTLTKLSDDEVKVYDRKDGLSGSMVWAVERDEAGDLWIGTDEGLCRFREGRFRVFMEKDGLPHHNVRGICRSRDGSLLMGTDGGGAFRVADGCIRPLDLPLTSAHLRSLMEASDGSLWIGSSGKGVDHWKDGTLKNYRMEDGLPGDTIFDLYEDIDGSIWVGVCDGGLARIHEGRIDAFTVEDGLFDDSVFKILGDEDGWLWMTCNKGVFKARREDLLRFAAHEIESFSCVSYGAREGMRIAECNGGYYPAGWKDYAGRLWFPTIRGAAMHDPRHAPFNAMPPPVIIERVVIDGIEYDSQAKAVVPPGKGSVTFEFTALSFLIPEKARFRYRLLGFDRDWVEAGNRRSALYTSLPPGNYRFQVIACNNDGVWNEEGARFEFEMRPRFRQTKSFYGLLGATGIGLGAAILRWREGEMRRRERALQRLVEERTRQLKERTRQLEEANCALQILSIQDGLTGIANHRHFIEEYEKEWADALRAGEPLSLIMCDIDSFKKYNDSYGHQMGNECLKRVAKILESGARRKGDLVARYGGEEFVALLPHADLKGAIGVAEDLRMKVEDAEIEHRRSVTGKRITLSFGVATARLDGADSPNALLSRADQALYLAKRQGRNRVSTCE